MYPGGNTGGPDLKHVGPHRVEMEIVRNTGGIQDETGRHETVDVGALPLHLHLAHEVQLAVHRGFVVQPDHRRELPVKG